MGGDTTCAVCLGACENAVIITACGHSFCKACVDPLSEKKCPVCRKDFIDTVPNWALRAENPNAAVMPTSPPVAPTASVKAEILHARLGNGKTLVSVRPTSTGRLPLHAVFILDVSGSMDTLATVGNENEPAPTVLGLVKHAVNTIVGSLSERDKISLITFSDNAEALLQDESCTDAQKSNVAKILKNVETQGGTNLWVGLQAGLETAKKSANQGMNTSIFLLTDGQPTSAPPRGINPAFDDLVKKQGCPGILHTFGFGYNLDVNLMTGLARTGGGTFNFIPDGSMVGTVFVNAVSTALCGAGDHAVLRCGKSSFDLGFFVLGQERTFLFDEDIDLNECDVQLNVSFGDCAVVLRELSESDAKQLADESLARKSVIELINKLSDTRARRGNLVDACIARLDEIGERIQDDTYIKALLQDVDGQVSEAIRENYFDRWGKFYLPSLRDAHDFQVCNNFKDPGVQLYASSLFAACRDKAEQVFLALPLPEVSGTGRSGGGRNIPYTAASFAGTYMNRSGGCFDGASMVSLANGTLKRVDQLEKDDELLHGAKVVCLVKTVLTEPVDMVRLGKELFITPYHPVRFRGRFIFPYDIAPVQRVSLPAFYNLVLDSFHLATISGVECVTLGHGFRDNSVVEHAYFGTHRVIDDLKTLRGFHDGLVVTHSSNQSRDPATGLVTSII